MDFVIQSLKDLGLDVRYDRAELLTGRRLWDQIDRGISDPARTDAWAIFATKQSLESEPCQEEIAYALDRALRTRGGDFPLIGIFPQPIERGLIPSAIATRLWVSLQDPNWAKQIAADLSKTPKKAEGDRVENFVVGYHTQGEEKIVELRPRAGQWYPAIFAVPTAEYSKVRLIAVGPAGRPPMTSMVSESDVAFPGYKGIRLGNAINNLTSIYVYLQGQPSEIVFGAEGELYRLFSKGE
ncbi:toll/interleukin-1 receptor domain-containing protein [Mesorhizobium sp. M0292]